MALPEALLCAAEGTRRLTRAAARLKNAVLAGIPLSEAFAREKFPRTTVQFCLLAEESGIIRAGSRSPPKHWSRRRVNALPAAARSIPP